MTELFRGRRKPRRPPEPPELGELRVLIAEIRKEHEEFRKTTAALRDFVTQLERRALSTFSKYGRNRFS